MFVFLLIENISDQQLLRVSAVDCPSMVLTQCEMCRCSPGDPEGGAWARQEWRDGRG